MKHEHADYIFPCQCAWPWIPTNQLNLNILGISVCTICVCVFVGGGQGNGVYFLTVYRQLQDMRSRRFKLLHSCDPSDFHQCCHGNHLDPCHWCRCSFNGEERARQRAREKCERGICGVRETVNDKTGVNNSCNLTIKTFLIMYRSWNECHWWLRALHWSSSVNRQTH